LFGKDLCKLAPTLQFLLLDMKRTYTGLSTRRVVVEGAGPLLQGSAQKIKSKTKVQDWHETEETHEMGISDIQLSTGIEP